MERREKRKNVLTPIRLRCRLLVDGAVRGAYIVYHNEVGDRAGECNADRRVSNENESAKQVISFAVISLIESNLLYDFN